MLASSVVCVLIEQSYIEYNKVFARVTGANTFFLKSRVCETSVEGTVVFFFFFKGLLVVSSFISFKMQKFAQKVRPREGGKKREGGGNKYILLRILRESE